MWTVRTLMLPSLRSLQATVLLAILVGVLWPAPVAEARASSLPPAQPPAGQRVEGAGPTAAWADLSAARFDRSVASTSPDPRTVSDAPDESPEAATANSSWGVQVVNGVVNSIVVLVIYLLLTTVLVGIPSTIAAVTAAMDDGPLRLGLFIIGWVLAPVCGFFAGVVTLLPLKEFLGAGAGAFGFMLGMPLVFLTGYGVARARIRRWLQSLPEAEAVAWRRTLTGGALVGAGVGSVAKLIRSVFTLKGSGFGGFGGGSFGGGGASGSWSGASGAASASSAGTGAVAGAGSGAAGTAPAASAAVRGAEAAASERGSWLTQWRRRLQWYHAAAFGLVTLVFYAVASFTMEMFPFWGAVVPTVLVVASGLWRWLRSAVSSLQGDRYRNEAASRSRGEPPLSSSRDRWTER